MHEAHFPLVGFLHSDVISNHSSGATIDSGLKFGTVVLGMVYRPAGSLAGCRPSTP
jgi:hypothetical protein